MTDRRSTRRVALDQALAAATLVANDWLARRHPALALFLIDERSVKATVQRFLRGARRRKVTWWDWERKFHRQVKYHDAWLFALQRGEQPVALCLGTICIARDHVALEYLERRPYARGVRGVPLAVAFQFALAVAAGLDLGEVRINEPLNDKLARHYEQALGMTPVRQSPAGGVQYLYRKVNP